MLEGTLLPSNMASKTTFCLYLVKHLIVTLICAVKVTTSSFQHFPWSLVQTLCFGHVPCYELTHFKKMVRVWKTKSLLFCLRYDPLIVFRRQNHITFIFIKMMSHDLLVQMAYCLFGFSTRKVLQRCRSLYVSGKLSIYPSPKPTLTLWSHLGKNVGLGEG